MAAGGHESLVGERDVQTMRSTVKAAKAPAIQMSLVVLLDIYSSRGGWVAGRCWSSASLPGRCAVADLIVTYR